VEEAIEAANSAANAADHEVARYRTEANGKEGEIQAVEEATKAASLATQTLNEKADALSKTIGEAFQPSLRDWITLGQPASPQSPVKLDQQNTSKVKDLVNSAMKEAGDARDAANDARKAIANVTNRDEAVEEAINALEKAAEDANGAATFAEKTAKTVDEARNVSDEAKQALEKAINDAFQAAKTADEKMDALKKATRALQKREQPASPPQNLSLVSKRGGAKPYNKATKTKHKRKIHNIPPKPTKYYINNT
jgi:uncharacterized phage infection (PIP) family protein YhgE